MTIPIPYLRSYKLILKWTPISDLPTLKMAVQTIVFAQNTLTTYQSLHIVMCYKMDLLMVNMMMGPKAEYFSFPIIITLLIIT